MSGKKERQKRKNEGIFMAGEQMVLQPDAGTEALPLATKGGAGGAPFMYLSPETQGMYEKLIEEGDKTKAVTKGISVPAALKASGFYDFTHPAKLGGRSEYKSDYYTEYLEDDWKNYREGYNHLLGKTPALAWAYDESPLSTLWQASKAFYNGMTQGKKPENIDSFVDGIRKRRHDFYGDLDKKYGGIPGTSDTFDYKDWYKYLGLIKSNIRKASERYTDLIARTDDSDTRKQLLYAFDKDRKAYLSLLISALKPYAARGNPSELNPHVEHSMEKLIGLNFDDNRYNITDSLITPDTTIAPVSLGAPNTNYRVRANA